MWLRQQSKDFYAAGFDALGWDKCINVFFFNWYSGGWKPRSTRHCGHQWPIVPAPGDYYDGEIGGIDWQGKPKYSEKTCLSAALSTTNPTCCVYQC
jgi:hypothetical protein